MILIDTDKPHLQPLILGKHENVASAIVFAATGADVSDVFVNGRQMVKDGALTRVDIKELMLRVRQTAEKIAMNV
jgi:5-methylthioadenosine/S-adenosylhomocysteine deaminase